MNIILPVKCYMTLQDSVNVHTQHMNNDSFKCGVCGCFACWLITWQWNGLTICVCVLVPRSFTPSTLTQCLPPWRYGNRPWATMNAFPSMGSPQAASRRSPQQACISIRDNTIQCSFSVILIYCIGLGQIAKCATSEDLHVHACLPVYATIVYWKWYTNTWYMFMLVTVCTYTK